MKVLFIGPVFYNYHDLIKNKIEALGAEVSFFPEKRDGILFSVLNTLNPSLIFFYQKYYYWLLWKRIKKNSYTHFFLIRGHKIPDFFLERLKENNPGIKLIMYQWDSQRNNTYFHIVKYFNKVYTFDYKDYKENNALDFLQLFYTEDIGRLREGNMKIKYDFFCFSSFTRERYESMLSLISFCNKNNLRLKTFCYIPYSTYVKFRFLKGMSLDKRFLSFSSMPKKEYLEFLGESEVVVDFSHSTQTGLSMRIIEAYGAGKKIVTTNHSILNNPIYSPYWVQLIDPKDIKQPIFQRKEEVSVQHNLYIDNWIKTLLK